MEKQWDKTEVNLGYVQPGRTYKVKFLKIGNKKIMKTLTSCGCTTAQISNKILEVTFKPGKANKYNKIVTVLYADNTKEFLRIKAINENNK